MDNVVLSVLAHPDDAEFLCAGTLIRLAREHGWQVHIASMTPGDCGSMELPGDRIAQMRRQEGARAAALIGAMYHCVEERDLLVFYAQEPLARVTRLLRQVRPRIVLTHSPADYMLDHEMTGTLARAAAFAAAVPNFLADRPDLPPPLPHIPHLYYCDPIEGKDTLGRPIEPGFRIDIRLLKHHGMDHYVESMRAWSGHRGKEAGVAFAEGFRQHLGHSYPQNNLLAEVLQVI
jgi:LmbE family N-acetylglucosaminyl deacetylase